MKRLSVAGRFERRVFIGQSSLEVNLFIQLSNLNNRWMRKPIPKVKANLYRLRQLMSVKFEAEEVLE